MGLKAHTIRRLYAAVLFSGYKLSRTLSVTDPSAAERLSGEARLQAHAHEQELLINKLRELLPYAPTWVRGHLMLAELALQKNDLATAYASAQAVLQLQNPESRVAFRAKLALGRCYQQRGAPEKARQYFEPLLQVKEFSNIAREELAASLLALGDYSGVISTLSTVPRHDLSQAALTALTYAQSKMN